MQTSMRVTRENRDALAKIAEEELGGATLDEALRVVLFEHETRVAITRLASNPEAAAGYLHEAEQLAEIDTQVAD